MNEALISRVELLAGGGHSARTIAKLLHITPGSAAGIVHRLRHPHVPAELKSREPALYPERLWMNCDTAMKAEIEAAAETMGVPRAETMRLLIEWGLEDMNERAKW